MPRQERDPGKPAKVKYSAAYSTGRERMLEPRYGCAGEALLRRVASPKASPQGPQGAARERRLEPRKNRQLTDSCSVYSVL